MKIDNFISEFTFYFPNDEIHKVSTLFEDKFTRSFFDPCFLVNGMTSIKVQKLLHIAFSCLEATECYFEIGTLSGKTLISAIKDNIDRKVYACDNFSEFQGTYEILIRNLERYGLTDKVIFYESNFRNIMNKERIGLPIGVYFYDGAHDENSQYDAIRRVENLLSDEALVIIDDWAWEGPRLGTERAVKESSHRWKMMYELPVRYAGDHAMWWNGIGIFSFNRH